MDDWRGKNEKQPKISRKTLLCQKKLLAFLRVSSFFLALLVLIRPVEARAGFWDWLFSGGLQHKTASLIRETYAASRQAPALAANNQPPGDGNDSGCYTGAGVIQDSTLVGTLNPAGGMTCAMNPYGQIFLYTVQSGDNPSSIAQSFGISLNTLLWANDIQNARNIKVGDTLVILPVSGVKYIAQAGDTIQSIATKFKGDVSDIINFNNLSPDAKLSAGEEIIIPDGELSLPPGPSGGASPRFSGLPDLKGYWLRPVAGGRKTQGIHGYNGVDLSSGCREPVFASAAGTVLVAKDSGWNAGYGKYIVLLHPNDVQTLYGHLLLLNVMPGQDVSQGETIGLEGNTGNVRGATGCHVHFEIRGARNPF